MYIKNNIYREDVKAAWEAVPEAERLYGKSFLVTGATGLVASFIIDMLMYLNTEKHAGIQIYALGRDQERLRQRYRSYQKSERLSFVVQDVCEPLKLAAHVDYIIHAAGDGYPAAFRENPVGTMMPALLGTFHLLDYARRYEAERVLYVSSGEVYGQGTGKAEAFAENDSGYVNILEARSCYPSAKRAAETLCASFLQQYGVRVVIARPAHTFGPNTTQKDNRANAQFINNILNGEDIVLKSAGSQLRSYTYIADIASGLLTVLLHGKPGEAYNVANAGERVTIAEFASCAAGIAGRKCVFEHPGTLDRAERTPISYAVLDTSKLRALGWQSRFSVETGIRHTLQIRKQTMEALSVEDNKCIPEAFHAGD